MRSSRGDFAGAGPDRLLLIQPRWMGDVLLCTPAIRAARQAFPAAEIDFLTESAGAGALAGNPHLSEILIARPGIFERTKLLRAIRRRHYDAVVDFRSTGSTAQVAWSSGARIRIGTRGRGPRNLAYTHLLPREKEPVYIAQQKLQLLEPLGIEASGADLSLELAIGEPERRRAERILAGADLDPEQPIVACSPISREAYKQWGLARWARVADEIADAGARVLLTSGPGEREQIAEVAARMRGSPIWDYGPTSVRELGALLERCSLWVGNDGGAKHVAVAAGTPTLTVIRWTLGPVWTETEGGRHAYLEAPPPGGCDLRCGVCPHRACLGAVRPEDVIAAVRSRLHGILS